MVYFKKNKVQDSVAYEEDERCPKCSRDRDLDVEILVGSCGHKLCRQCVTDLYELNSEMPCNVNDCNKKLRKGDYKPQKYGDLNVHLEVLIRADICKIYNKPREAFSSDDNGLRQYNNFLETIERLVFNRLNDIYIKETNAEIEQYRRDNDLDIRKYANENQEAADKIVLQVQEQEKQKIEKQMELHAKKMEEKFEAAKENENLLEDLQTQTVSSVQARIKNQTEMKERVKNAEKQKLLGSKKRQHKIVLTQEEMKLYEYEKPEYPNQGPPVPEYNEIKDDFDIKYQPPSTIIANSLLMDRESAKFRGFEYARHAQRSLEEAFNCLYLPKRIKNN